MISTATTRMTWTDPNGPGRGRCVVDGALPIAGIAAFAGVSEGKANRAAGTLRGEDSVEPLFKKANSVSWLPDMDLNHDKQIQSLLCYRYTIGQSIGRSR